MRAPRVVIEAAGPYNISMPNVRQAIQKHLDDIGWSVNHLVEVLDGPIAPSALREFIGGTATLNTRELGLVMDALGLEFTATPEGPRRTRSRGFDAPQAPRIPFEDVNPTPGEMTARLHELMRVMGVKRYLRQLGDQQVLIHFRGSGHNADPQFLSFVRVMQLLGGSRFNNKTFTIPSAKASVVLIDAIVS